MAEGEKLENPFAKSAGAGGSDSDRDGFLAFSSSTPRGSPSGGGPRGFRPKWGKANRQDNWRRFGQYNDQEQQRMNMSAPNEMMSPLPGGRGFGHRGFRGSPHQQFSPNFRGGRGNSPNFRGGFRGRGGGPPPPPFMMQGHPGFRGHSPNYRGGRPGGGHRGRGGGRFDQTSESDGQGYFHPSMLEDPWARLEQQRASTSFTRPEKATNDGEEAGKQLSDSMIPQVGESFFERNLNPAPDVDVSMGAVDDTDGKDNADVGEGEDSVDEGAADDGGGAAAVLSDSMVPLVGDSILQGSESTMESTSANSSCQDQE